LLFDFKIACLVLSLTVALHFQCSACNSDWCSFLLQILFTDFYRQ